MLSILTPTPKVLRITADLGLVALIVACSTDGHFNLSFISTSRNFQRLFVNKLSQVLISEISFSVGQISLSRPPFQTYFRSSINYSFHSFAKSFCLFTYHEQFTIKSAKFLNIQLQTSLSFLQKRTNRHFSIKFFLSHVVV